MIGYIVDGKLIGLTFCDDTELSGPGALTQARPGFQELSWVLRGQGWLEKEGDVCTKADSHMSGGLGGSRLDRLSKSLSYSYDSVSFIVLCKCSRNFLLIN